MLTRSLILTAIITVAGSLVAQAQTPTITSIANNAAPGAGNAPIAPGELVNVFGTNLGDTPPVNCGSPAGIPNSCGGVSVTVGGKTAPVRGESATQLIIQVPVDLTGNSASVVVTRVVGGQNLMSQPFNATVAPTSPQMFLANVNGAFVANCFSAGSQVSPSNPALPGAVVRCLGTGFGVTNPVVPSGQVQPQSPLPAVVAAVKVTIANVNATGISASLAAGNGVGQNQVLFTVPQGVLPGPQPVVVTVGGVSASPVPLAIAGALITGGPVNAASYALAGLPNAGIAQGSMFILFGQGIGPFPIVNASSFPLQTNLGGTSIKVTVGGTTVDAIMLYSVGFQVAAILPSRTPVGNGTVTLTFNNQTSNTVPIRVVANSFGTFTRNQGGSGPGILFNFNSQTNQPVNSLVEAAHPGQVLTLWGTGLGAVTGNEAAAAPVPGNLDVPVDVYVGNKLVTPTYKGRSPCCAAIDQINFAIPDGVEGCYVSVAVRAGGVLSNIATIAVTSSGSICSDPGGFSVTDLQKVQGGGTLNLGDLTVARIHARLSLPGLGNLEGNLDVADGHFRHYPSAADVLASYRGSRGSLLGLPSAGSCTVAQFEYQDFLDALLQFGGDIVNTTGLDAGAAINVAGPRGAKQVPRQDQGPPGQPSYSYRVPGDLIGGSIPGLFDSGLPDYVDPGSYTENNGSGGTQVGAFSASLTVPSSTVVWTNQEALSNIPRSQDLTVTWTGGAAGGLVAVFGSAANPSVGAGAAFTCSARADAGTLTIPSWVLSSLPASGVNTDGRSVGGLSLATTLSPTRFAATGIDAGFLNWGFVQLKNVVYQ